MTRELIEVQVMELRPLFNPMIGIAFLAVAVTLATMVDTAERDCSTG